MEEIKNMKLKERIELAEKGKNKDLDILVNDKSEWIRKVVAMQGRDKDLKIFLKE